MFRISQKVCIFEKFAHLFIMSYKFHKFQLNWGQKIYSPPYSLHNQKDGRSTNVRNLYSKAFFLYCFSYLFVSTFLCFFFSVSRMIKHIMGKTSFGGGGGRSKIFIKEIPFTFYVEITMLNWWDCLETKAFLGVVFWVKLSKFQMKSTFFYLSTIQIFSREYFILTWLELKVCQVLANFKNIIIRH